jgi:hypothetical protein
MGVERRFPPRAKIGHDGKDDPTLVSKGSGDKSDAGAFNAAVHERDRSQKFGAG